MFKLKYKSIFYLAIIFAGAAFGLGIVMALQGNYLLAVIDAFCGIFTFYTYHRDRRLYAKET